jgi:hypothetical protein
LRPWPWKLAVHVASGVARALALAHAAKYDDGTPLNRVHRDVCPSIVLVRSSGHVKRFDFGVVRSALGARSLAQVAADHRLNRSNLIDALNGQSAPTRRDIEAMMAELGDTFVEWRRLFAEAMQRRALAVG